MRVFERLTCALRSRGRFYATVLTLLRNVLDKPDEAKFRSINSENATIKAKVRARLPRPQLVRGALSCAQGIADFQGQMSKRTAFDVASFVEE